MNKRTIQFPSESIGYLYLVDTFGVVGRHDEWTVNLGAAAGLVTVEPFTHPGNWMLQLCLTCQDLSPLAKLGPDDLESLVSSSGNKWNSSITNESFEHIGHLTGLKELWLVETAATDAALSRIVQLRNLESLGLPESFISDVGIGQLETLSRLQLLSLAGTLVSEAGITRLQRALPHCTVLAPPTDERTRWRLAKTADAMALLSQVKQTPNDVNLNLQLADAFMEISAYPRGLELYDQAVRIRSNDPVIIRRRGLARQKAMQASLALEDFNLALSLAPSDAVTLIHRGIWYLDMFEFKQAKADFELALSIDPNNDLVHVELGRMNVYRGNLRRAVSHFNKAIKLNPHSSDAFYERAMIHEHQEKLDKAIDDCSAAIRNNEMNINALMLRAKLLEQLERIDLAIQDWQTLREFSEKWHDGKALWYENKIQQAMAQKSQQKE